MPVIVPVRDLKDTNRISELCNSERRPVFITKNGYGKLVIMEIATFERLLGNYLEAKAINEALDEYRAGKVEDGPSVIEEMKKKYGL